jgi:hypothetical protein
MLDCQDKRLLTLNAWLTAGAHAAGLVMAVVGMRSGTPLVSLDQRMAYLAKYPLGWSLGWGTWMLSALTLVAFLAVLACHVGEGSMSANLALMLASSGVAVDLFCDILYITVLPMVAADNNVSLFLAVERAAGAGGTVVANGLYSVAVLLATIALRSRRAVPNYVLWLGYGTFLSGMLMVVAGFTALPWLMQFATIAAIGFFIPARSRFFGSCNPNPCNRFASRRSPSLVSRRCTRYTSSATCRASS